MPKIERIRDLFDEHHEVAAWLVLVGSFVLLSVGKLEQWPFVAMVGLSLLTLLGSKRYSGISVGPGGLEVEK